MNAQLLLCAGLSFVCSTFLCFLCTASALYRFIYKLTFRFLYPVNQLSSRHCALCQRLPCSGGNKPGCCCSGLHCRLLIKHPKQNDEEIDADGADEGS